MQDIIELSNISFSYKDGKTVLSNVSMKFKEGKRIAILGANGSGKTTLLFHLNALLKPTSGYISLNNKRLGYSKKEVRNLRENVGLVFQDPDTQIFAPTVYEELAFGPNNIGLSVAEVKDRVENALLVTNILHLKDKPTYNLSYGEKKRVCIASIVAMGSKVFVLDEPTVFLDEKSIQGLFKIFDTMHKSGNTIIFTTHNMDFAYLHADYVFVLDKGMLVKQGSPQNVFLDTANLKMLRRPFVVELFNELDTRGLLASYDKRREGLPKTREEVFYLLNKKLRDTKTFN